MLKKIIRINEERCIGCGRCVMACEQGAIGKVNGKAKVLREDYCDGLGMCLPVCPADAIYFIEKEVIAPVAEPKIETPRPTCPGMQSMALAQDEPEEIGIAPKSKLRQWPIQIKLMPIATTYYNDANILVAGDCCAYAYGNFHNEFMNDKITLVGCPKLDNIDYSEKLTDIFTSNSIKSVTVTRMSVPCCGGIERATAEAIKRSGKNIEMKTIIISTDGKIIS